MYLGAVKGLGAGVYVGTNFGTSECPPGWYRTNPGKWPVHCLQNAAPAAAPYAPPPPVNISNVVSPTIATQVSPNISPVFQQQWQPSNSPATAGTSQTVPQLPGITSQAQGPAREVDYSKLFESLANQPAQSTITASLPSGGGTTVVEASPRSRAPAGGQIPMPMMQPAPAMSPILPLALIGGGAALFLLLRKSK